MGATLKVPLVKMGLTMDKYVESFITVPFTKAVKYTHPDCIGRTVGFAAVASLNKLIGDHL